MDPLSAVVGGIGVASFGIQIAESIQNCLRFWRSVRDAPSDIGRIVEDLEVLDEILNSVMTYHQGLQRSGNSLQPIPIPRALRSCFSRLKDVNRTINDLEMRFQTRKIWTSLRAAVREEAISKVRRDLETAKSSLLLSNLQVLYQLQQAQCRSIVAQQNDISDITQSITQLSVNMTRPSTRMSPRLQTFQNSPLLRGNVQEILRDDGERPHTHAKPQAPTLRPSVPTSTLSGHGGVMKRAFSLYSQTALRDSRVVPSTSPIFKYAQRGDVEQLWNLFDQGLASPFDTDCLGYTPLHFAAEFFQPFACKILLDLGADSNALTTHGFTPLGVLSTETFNPATHSVNRVVDLTRVLVLDGNADPFTETTRGVPVCHSYGGTIDGLKLLRNQDPFGNSMVTQNVDGWGVLHEQLCRALYKGPFLVERLRFWIAQGADVNAKVQPSTRRGFYGFLPAGTTPLHIACQKSVNIPRSFPPLVLREGLLELFLKAGADIHVMDELGYTPLRLIAEQSNTEALFQWFKLLDNLSVDLLNYISIECSIYEEMLEEFNPRDALEEVFQYSLHTDMELEGLYFFSHPTGLQIEEDFALTQQCSY